MPPPNNSVKAVLMALKSWKYNQLKASSYNIARSTGFSQAAVVKTLRDLKERGFVNRNLQGSYFICLSGTVKEALKNLKKTSLNVSYKNNNDNYFFKQKPAYDMLKVYTEELDISEMIK